MTVSRHGARHVSGRTLLGTQPNVEGLPRFTNTTLLHLGAFNIYQNWR